MKSQQEPQPTSRPFWWKCPSCDEEHGTPAVGNTLFCPETEKTWDINDFQVLRKRGQVLHFKPNKL